MKRSKLDKVFSDLVRERAEWTCERCSKVFPEGQRQGLDCSHLYGRRHKSTRWHPDNAFAHCRGCHQYLGSNPVIFAGFAKDRLGQTRLDWLMARHNRAVKYTRADLEDMYQHYKVELAIMQEKRSQGQTGHIDFTAWD